MPERSFIAGAAEPVMKFRATRKKFIEPEACSAYISQMARAQRVKYVLPRAARLTGRITESDYDGMQYFTIVPKDGVESRVKITYLHGGSYFAPPNILHWDMLLKLGEMCAAEVTAPLYPRAPLRTCSAAYDELEGFLRKIRPEVLMGDSAGGGLALGLAQTMGEEAPRKLILLSPWLDAALDNPGIPEYEPLDVILGSYGLRRMGKVWAGSLDIRDPRVSPIYGDFSAVDDLTMLIGTHELFYPDVMKLAAVLEQQGRPCRVIVGEGMSHVWPCYPMKEGRETLVRIAELISGESVPL